MSTLADCYFGDYEAQDESIMEEDFFIKTFVYPPNLSTKNLNNKRNTIILGRKGSGKTTLQIYMAKSLEQEGFLTAFFSFFNELEPKDYQKISNTQSMSVLKIDDNKKLLIHYDYRNVWRRVFLHIIGKRLVKAKKQTKFTEFVIGKKNYINNIFDGLTKNLKVKIDANLFSSIKAEIEFDSRNMTSQDEILIDDYNKISMELLKKHHPNEKFYLFVDELSFSNLDQKPDEIRAKSAMVRDIIRICNEFNLFFVKNSMPFHVICSLRPEIKEILIDNDPEIGKSFSKEARINWGIMGSPDNSHSLIMEIMRKKIFFGFNDGREINDILLCKNITFGTQVKSIEEFIKTNTWERPRDIVRLLNAIKDANGNKSTIGPDEIKSSLNRYSKESLKEVLDEISVRGGRQLVQSLRSGIYKQTYASGDRFWDAISKHINASEKSRTLEELYNSGFIGNKRGRNLYWAYRDGGRFRSDLGVIIHRSLWNELRIR